MKQKMFDFIAAYPQKAIGNSTAWFDEEGVSIYLRKGLRYVSVSGSLEKRTVLDISSVSANKPGKGAFTKLLPKIEQAAKEAGYYGVYIENVLEERFQNFFAVRGYVKTNPSEDIPCFLKAF